MNNIKKHTYLLVGLTGSGKSTTGNCIFNRSGVLSKVSDTPFPSSDSAMGCTRNFAYKENERVFVLDTVGFGDPNFKQDYILKELKRALKEVDNKVDCVVYVVKKGRFTNQTVEFFNVIQNKVLKDKCKNNSVLIVTDCNDPEWTRRQLNDEFFTKVIENCGGIENAYCFRLRFENEASDEENRQEAINRMLEFLNSKNFEKIDLSHIQTKDFDLEWVRNIVPKLIKILAKAFNVDQYIPNNLADEAGNFAYETLNSTCNQQ